jgi:DNA-binding FadR family transcriptional regulator
MIETREELQERLARSAATLSNDDEIRQLRWIIEDLAPHLPPEEHEPADGDLTPWDWLQAVARGDTRFGYHGWVWQQRDQQRMEELWASRTK